MIFDLFYNQSGQAIDWIELARAGFVGLSITDDD
jgi:hypothetical protein